MQRTLLDMATEWTQGEIAQGKAMLVMGVLVIFACYALWRTGGELLRGMIIPMLLVSVICLGYGSFLVRERPKQLHSLSISHGQAPEQALSREENKAASDRRAYRALKITWGFVILAGLALVFLAPRPYWKGVALGLLFLGVSTLIVDTVLDHRVTVYHENMQNLKSNPGT